MGNEKDIPISNQDYDEQFTEYDGWLRFFRIINCINYVVCATAILLGLGGLAVYGWESKQELMDSAFRMINLLPSAIISFIVWKTVLNVSEKTPDAISMYLFLDLVISLVFWGALYYFHEMGLYSDKPMLVIDSVVYYLIWSNYFKTSKRVLKFYGKNAV